MPVVTDEQILGSLTKKRLATLAAQLDVEVLPRARKADIVAELVGRPDQAFDKLLLRLERTELERICAKHELEGRSALKSELLCKVLAARSMSSARRQNEGAAMIDLAEKIASRSNRLREDTTDRERKRWGQYFTGAGVARFMAKLLATTHVPEVVRLLDPGAGTGILGAVAAEELLAAGARKVELVSVEREPSALAELRSVLSSVKAKLGERFSYSVLDADVLGLAEPELGATKVEPFDFVISNPPYFKMPPSEVRGGDSPNIYTRFMEVASRLLKPLGSMCFIIPRSFASGLYFKRFRKTFHARMTLERVHVFASRKDAFKADGVLQENIIVLYRREAPAGGDIVISTSLGASNLDSVESLRVRRTDVFNRGDSNALLFLPESRDDLALLDSLRRWPGRLRDHGLEISTGPVVPFRAESLLLGEPNGEPSVPLLWMQHVRANGVTWPAPNGLRKPQHIRADAPPKLLVPNRTYVLLRRFSAKEEARRLTAAVLRRGQVPGKVVGLENHLNFIHRPEGELRIEEARGLAAVLNSRPLDRYFRISNGNTQVNATEIRALPLPPLESIAELGSVISKDERADADALVEEMVGVES